MKRKLFDNLKRKYIASVLTAVFSVSAFSNCVRAMEEKDERSKSLIILNNFHLENNNNNNNNDEEQQLNPEECMVGKVKGSDILKAVKKCNEGKSYETIPEGKDLLKAMGLGEENIDEILQGTGLDINSLPKRDDLVTALAEYNYSEGKFDFNLRLFVNYSLFRFNDNALFNAKILLKALEGDFDDSKKVLSKLREFHKKFFSEVVRARYGKKTLDFYLEIEANHKYIFKKIPQGRDLLAALEPNYDVAFEIDNKTLEQLPTRRELLVGLIDYYLKNVKNYDQNNLGNYVKVFCEEKLLDMGYFDDEFLVKAVSNYGKDKNPFLGKLKPYCVKDKFSFDNTRRLWRNAYYFLAKDNGSEIMNPFKRMCIRAFLAVRSYFRSFNNNQEMSEENNSSLDDEEKQRCYPYLHSYLFWCSIIGAVLFIAMVITIMVVGKKVDSTPNKQKAPNNETTGQKTGEENNSSESGNSSNTRSYAQTTNRTVTLAALGAAAGEGIAFLSGNVQSNGEKIESEVNLLKNSEKLSTDSRRSKIEGTETNSSADIIPEKSKDSNNEKSKSKETVGGAF